MHRTRRLCVLLSAKVSHCCLTSRDACIFPIHNPPLYPVYPQFLFSLSHSRATLHRSFSSMFIFRTNKHFLIMFLKKNQFTSKFLDFFPLCLCAFISNECRVFHLGVLYISTFLYTNDRFFIFFSWYWTFICQTNVIDWGLLVLSETECETLHVLEM